jgi:ankyrin repeat protein
VPISYRAAQTLIKRGDEPALRAALATGLDPNLVNQNGWSLLMLAAVEGDVPLGRLLLEFNADPALQNNKGETALTLAQHRGFDLFAALIPNP